MSYSNTIKIKRECVKKFEYTGGKIQAGIVPVLKAANTSGVPDGEGFLNSIKE